MPTPADGTYVRPIFCKEECMELFDIFGSLDLKVCTHDWASGPTERPTDGLIG